MILKSTPFPDMVRKLHQQITFDQWTKLLAALDKSKEVDPKFIRSEDGRIRINTSLYLEEEKYGPFNTRLPASGVMSKVWIHDIARGVRLAVRFNYSPTLGQVWDLEASCNDDYSIRVPMLRNDGCYAGAAKGPDLNSAQIASRRRKRK